MPKLGSDAVQQEGFDEQMMRDGGEKLSYTKKEKESLTKEKEAKEARERKRSERPNKKNKKKKDDENLGGMAEETQAEEEKPAEDAPLMPTGSTGSTIASTGDSEEEPAAAEEEAKPKKEDPRKKKKEKKPKAKTEAKKPTGNAGQARGVAVVNGQAINMTEYEQKKLAWEMEDMDMAEAVMAERRLRIFKIMKKAPRWSKYVTHLELNDDPLKMWTNPIVKVSMNLRVEQMEKAMTKMMAYCLRCMVLDPPNEDKIRQHRAKFEDLWFKLRQVTEIEADYEPIFQQTMNALAKTQERLEGLQAGMGYDASEASASSCCQEAAMEKLKQTRKQMQYTVANLGN